MNSEGLRFDSRLGSPVPGSGVQHVRVEEVYDDTADIVEVPGENDGLGSQSCGTDLGDERVTNRPNGYIVRESEDDEEGADTETATGRGRDGSEDTSEDHEDEEDDLTVKVEISSTERLHEEPRRDGTDTTNDEHDQVECGGGLGSQPSACQEVGC